MGIVASLGEAVLDLVGDDTRLNQDVKKAKGNVLTALKSLSTKVIGLGVVGLTAATTALVGFTAAAIPAGSDLNETINKTQVVFGTAADAILKFSETADTALGQSQQSALDAASTFGIFGKSAGLSGSDLSDFSTNLVGLTSDMASFYNTSPEDAILAVGAALRGESEPIRKYGVLLDEATLRNQAFQMGLIDSTKKALTPQQRVLAAYNVILAQTTDAQGDFARTSSGLANSQRIVSAQLQNLKATWGRTFLPIVEKGAQLLSQKFLPVLTDLVEKIGPELTDLFTGAEDPIGSIYNIFYYLGKAIGLSDEQLGPLLTNLRTLEDWLSVNLPIAVQILSNFWTTVLWPAIQAVWGWISGTLIPFLQGTVFPWLATNLPIALQTLANFWTTVLWPAIQAVWSWMSGTLFPFLESLGELIAAGVGKDLEILAGLWQNVLYPALNEMWSFLSTYVFPILQDIANWILEKLIPAFNGISSAVQSATGWIGGLAEKIKNLKLPDWLTPGSPTPFELGLRGINDALDEMVRKQLPGIQAGLNLNTPGMALTGAGAGPVSIPIYQNFYGPTSPEAVFQASQDGVLAASRQIGFKP